MVGVYSMPSALCPHVMITSIVLVTVTKKSKISKCWYPGINTCTLRKAAADGLQQHTKVKADYTVRWRTLTLAPHVRVLRPLWILGNVSVLK